MEQATAVDALLSAQKIIGKVAKNCENPFHKSKYADYEAVLDAVKKPLNDHGFVLIHRGVVIEGKDYLQTALVHSSGAEFTSQFPVVVDGNPQHMGSAITYIKRYNLASLTGLATEEDDDGNAAAKVQSKPVSTPSSPTKTAEIAPGIILAVFMPSKVESKKSKDGTKSFYVIHNGNEQYSTLKKEEADLAQKALSQGKEIKLSYAVNGNYKNIKSITLTPDPIGAILEQEPPKEEEIPW